jgi:hypothetical protein
MLVAGTALMVALYLLIEAVDPLGHVGGLRALVDLGGSGNIPAWWNSLLMALVAVTAFAARATPAQERTERRAWTVVGLAAVALSLHEVARPLSVVGQWAREMRLSAVVAGWPILALAGLLAVFWAWRRLPSQLLAWQLGLSAAVYVAGAVVVDAFNNLISRQTYGLIFAAGTLAEELLEMSACVVAVTAILDYVVRAGRLFPA